MVDLIYDFACLFMISLAKHSAKVNELRNWQCKPSELLKLPLPEFTYTSSALY